MSKRLNTRATVPVAPSNATGQSAPSENSGPKKTLKEKSTRASKQARVIAMLRSPAGTTIAAMMKATDWQQHSVRGFLAGVVKKKLKLKVKSEKIDDSRVYRIVEPGGTRSKTARPRRRV
jgi:hypothetical protein